MVGYTEHMNKKMWIGAIILALVVIVGGYIIIKGQPSSGGVGMAPAVFDPLNATYNIEGQPITLVNGKSAIQAAPGSTSLITTSAFGQPTIGDVNGDGKADAALILVRSGGGSGTFYYVAAAIDAPSGTQGTNAVLLGDRIAPQNVQIANGQIIANYAVRKSGEPMTTAPSVGMSMYFSYDSAALKLRALAPAAVVGESCGGNRVGAPICEHGSHCAPDPTSHLPFGDVGGTCVKN